MESTRGARKFEQDLMKPNVNMTNWRNFFLLTFFSRVVWLELFPWATSQHVAFIHRPQMCRQTRQVQATAPEVRAGTRLALVGKGGLGQHFACERLVSVRDGGGIPLSTPNKGSLCSKFVSFQRCCIACTQCG